MSKKKKKLTKARLAHGIKHGYRSGLEEKIAAELDAQNVQYGYETMKIEFVQPEKKRKYTPDFVLPNGIIVETKGRFTTEDRHKHLWIKEQHPDLDIRFVFSNPNTRIRKGSNTTYAIWCQKNGFQFAARSIPQAWLNEKPKKKKKKK